VDEQASHADDVRGVHQAQAGIPHQRAA
jgi:hypothetical protein